MNLSGSLLGILVAQLALLFGIALVDIQRRTIHSGLLLVLAGVSLVRVLAFNEPALQSAGIGALLAGLGFGLVYQGGKLYGRRIDAPSGAIVFGLGDVWLGAVCGLAVGFPGALVVLLLAMLFGGLSASLHLALCRWRDVDYRRFTVLPYAQNIAAATALALLFPELAAQVFSAW